MKKGTWFIASMLVTLAGFQSCRHNPFTFLLSNHEPDSLYTGRPYKLRVPSKFPAIVAGPVDSMTYEGVELGRRLFYDKHLSLGGKKSCGSCHHLNVALSDSGFAKSVNEMGLSARNAPALQNLVWNNQFFWDGRSNSPEDQ